jgi:hypothetical protein
MAFLCGAQWLDKVSGGRKNEEISSPFGIPL